MREGYRVRLLGRGEDAPNGKMRKLVVVERFLQNWLEIMNEGSRKTNNAVKLTVKRKKWRVYEE